jgi:uncharacterized membrane protein
MAKDSTTDVRLQSLIGQLLQTGVLLSAGTVAAGAIGYLIGHAGDAVHYATFRRESSDLRQLSGIFGQAFSLDSRGIVQLGLLLLIATPVARVACLLVAFALEKDRTYVLIATIVLVVLTVSFVGGRAG